MILAATSTANDRQGNGKYRPARRRKATPAVQNEFEYLNTMDKRMRFNNSKDPIYTAFDYLEKCSIATLAEAFVKDSFFQITNFVSKVVK